MKRSPAFPTSLTRSFRREVAQDTQSEVISETREQVMRRVAEASNRSEISRQQALDLFNNKSARPEAGDFSNR